MNVLLVEDDERIIEFVLRGLHAEGYHVDVARNGRDALRRASVPACQLIILDLLLPDLDGREVCRQLRAASVATPILMLTALDTLDDRVRGLRMGADDYLAKPFAFEELVARVQALGRRATPAAPPVLTVGNLVLDQTRRVVTRAGAPVDLTNKEFGVLEELLKARGGVVSSEELLERVWDANIDPFTTTVRVTINTLRKKIGDPPLIETVVGAGYRVPEPVVAS